MTEDVVEFAQKNLDLGLANNPQTATPLEASMAYLALTEMYSHRGDGIPTQYTHGAQVADLARTMWVALLTALRSRGVPSTLADEIEAMSVIEKVRVWLQHGRISFGRTIPIAALDEVVRLAAQGTSPVIDREAVLEEAVLDDFLEEWSDCGNFGWCAKTDKCTRHNPDEYRAAIRVLKSPVGDDREGGWDHRYRRLEEGEMIVETDECQNDDGSWMLTNCPGTRAPDPCYTSHRTYRRLKSAPTGDYGELIGKLKNLADYFEANDLSAATQIREAADALSELQGRVERAEGQGASADADRDAGLRPQPPAASSQSSIPSAEDFAGIADAGPWLVATVLSITETGVVDHAMHARWLNRCDRPPPFSPDNAGWGDLFAAGYLALARHRAAQVDTHPKGGDANAAPFMSGAVAEGDAPETPGDSHDQ